jgi:hypothetical protein
MFTGKTPFTAELDSDIELKLKRGFSDEYFMDENWNKVSF